MHGEFVPITLFAMIAVVVIGAPIARAYARRLERSEPPRIPDEVVSRLERMEQAIDSIAIEVERISEGQRFTTRLLSERSGEARDAPPRSEQRSTVPGVRQ